MKNSENFLGKRILIGGIEGVGKTSIIKGCLEKNKDLGGFYFGNEFVKEAKKDKNFDGFENLTMEQRKKIENKINTNVENLDCNNAILFDAHYTILQNGEYINCNNDEFIGNNFDYLVLIKLRSDIILNRIKFDNKDRTSITKNIEKIDFHAELEEKRAEDLAINCNLKLLKIENLNLNESIYEILKVIKI